MSVGSGSGERSALTSSSHPPLNLCSESFAFVVVLGASVLAASVCCSWNLALRLRSSSSMDGTAAASMPSSVACMLFFTDAARMDLYDILPSNGTDMALNAKPSSSSTVTASRVVEGGFTDANTSELNSTPSEPSFEV